MCSELSHRARGAVITTALAACVTVGAAACSSSSGGRGTPSTPAPAAAGSVGTDEVDINAINPIGPFFEHRLDYALSDSEITKLSAIDSRFLVDSRPVRRLLDSLRTEAHEFNGYLPNAPKGADTTHVRRSTRDSVQQLHDAVAEVSAQLRARARRARSEALDVLTLEQLERVALLGTGLTGYIPQTVSNRRGGGGTAGRAQTNPNGTSTRMVANAYPTIRDPLRGIVLSDSQRVRVDSIRTSYRAQARDLGDPVGTMAAPIRDLIRRQYDAIRDVLTPDQQVKFDKNRVPSTGTPTPKTAPQQTTPAKN